MNPSTRKILSLIFVIFLIISLLGTSLLILTSPSVTTGTKDSVTVSAE